MTNFEKITQLGDDRELVIRCERIGLHDLSNYEFLITIDRILEITRAYNRQINALTMLTFDDEYVETIFDELFE